MKDFPAPRFSRLACQLMALSACLSMTTLAAAQDQDQSAEAGEEVQEVIVTGFRASLRESLDIKRDAGVMVDAITSEDIADFPDANLAESLQRIPGISIDRDQGEGRTITVRGLGADFSRVRINGLEALSTAGSNDAGSSPNRSRSFDFNTFASELFSSLKVQKTSSAETDEGSLGATVDLTTGRPFDFQSFAAAVSAEDSYYENGEFHNPKLGGLFTWHNEKFGVLFSGAYSERQTEIDQYRRAPGQPDYLYRQSDYLGNESPQRSGFAAPAGTNLGYVNPAATAAMTGSDPVAYANLYPGAPYQTPGRFDDSLVRIPSLASVEQSDVAYKRLGVTNSYQWKPTDQTSVNLDLLYSNYEYSNIISQVSTVGLNRNNTLANYNAATTTLTVAQRRAMYPNSCTPVAPGGTAPPQDCGGTTLVPGYQFSFRPNNLDPYEYYNNPNSPGFVADPSGRGLGFRDAVIGRPAVDVLASHVENGVADYLVLRNVDMRSAADASFYTTEFKQASLNVTHDFTENFHLNLVYGQSESVNDSNGQLVEFNAMDTQGPFVYDERDHGSMPVLDFGFDAANPANWGIVKAFSAMRNYRRIVENTYDGGRIDLKWDFNEKFSLAFGGNLRTYEFLTQQRERNFDVVNPTEREANTPVSSLGRVIQFGDGLDLPEGTLTSFWAPNLAAFEQTFGFTCNCVNQYGDFRQIRRNNGRDDFSVSEDDMGAYLQLNFDLDLFGHRMFGNVGVRQAWTEVESIGNSNSAGGLPIVANHEYDDTLPSINLAFEMTEDLLLRLGAAKVMARPLLGNLAPTITAISVPTATGVTTGASLTIGNPYLSPFRGTNYDISLEWYFAEGGLLSAAYFTKDIETFPQTVIFDAPLSTFMDEDGVAQIAQGFTDPDQIIYLNNDYDFRARQFRDAPGGDLKGYELSYQQDFTFLPGFLKNFGAQINFTHIDSELNYILDPGDGANIPQTTAVGPWLGASPEALNFTLYYETQHFSGRVSVADRAEYFTTFPIAAGSCSPGINTTSGPIPASPNTAPAAYCNAPLISDFVGSQGTTNVDMSLRWIVNDNMSFALEMLNLTNQTSDRFAYVDNPVVTQYGSTGRQYTLGMRYKF